MLASNKLARGLACLCVAVAACAVQAKPKATNPFRTTEVRTKAAAPSESKRVDSKELDAALEDRNDNPFRGPIPGPLHDNEAKQTAAAVEVIAPPAISSEKKPQPAGKDEVFFPFACDPLTCDPFATENVLLANPLAVKMGDVKTAWVPAAAEEVATPRSQPYQKPIGVLGVNISLPQGALPKSESQEIVSNVPFAGNMPRPWPSLVYHWEAAATWHQPLYFEEVNAERYGYQCNWVAQPFVSTAHFFGTLPALPYLMTVNCPRECVYTLGNYRPGSCPPWRRHCIPCYDFRLW
ncbi:hypothetical protein [Aeoliella sp. SH292]|uniref:hypothetical protein n=1 Tax=Aeoliella sp. SH292 TaxID=3454464 RepID=UPI003F95780E